MYENFKEVLIAKGLKVADVVKSTGIAHSTLTDWKNGKTTPKLDKMQKIADYLGVTVEYLTTGKNAPEFVMPDYDAREHELIEKFGLLSDKQKDLILNVIDEFLPDETQLKFKTLISEYKIDENKNDNFKRLWKYYDMISNYYLEMKKANNKQNEDELKDALFDMYNNVFNTFGMDPIK